MAGIVGLLRSTIWRLRGGVSVTDVTLDPGGGPNVSAEHFQPAGDDAVPLPGDYSYAGPGPQKGRYAAVGYLDARNPPVASAGEKRMYSRNQTGVPMAAIWIKADGAIRGENAAGYFELEPGGDFWVNGARITVDGDVITSDGVSLRNHPHNQGNDSGNDSEVPTDPPTPTE